MQKKFSSKQWIGSVFILFLFVSSTILLYAHFHEDARFERFAEDFFVSELCSNPVNLHYTLTDASAYGIDESAVALPVYHADQASGSLSDAEEALAALAQFHPEKLEQENQYTYVLLSTYLTAVRDCAAYPYFEEPLSPSSGVQSGLPILLADYRLSSPADIENYLSILSQIPVYLDGIMRYEQEKAGYGLFMSDSSADKVIEQCARLMDPALLKNGRHFLVVTFRERLDQLTAQGVISEAEAQAWQSENERLLATVVAPAYDKLADSLTLLKSGDPEPHGLSFYADGRSYYQAYLRMATGSYRSVPEIKEMLSKDFEKNYTTLITLLKQNPALSDALSSGKDFFPDLSPEEMLSILQSMITEDYPAISFPKEETAVCTVKYVDESLEPYSAPAFYLTPPIDNTRENTIYINQPYTTGGLSLFTTLAHEGYPGHLYQTVYSEQYLHSIGSGPLRSILYYGGYVEGWAMYVELNSYDYALRLNRDKYPDAESLYLAEKANKQIQLSLYSLLDIMIHYEGASYENVRQILSAIGLTEEAAIRAVYEYIIEEPCNYLKYYLGYLEIEALKAQAKDIWGSAYSPRRFHTFLLNNGPADFRTLSRLILLSQADVPTSA